MRITVLVVSPLFFGLVRVTNSTPVLLHQSGEAMQAKNPSNTILNQRAPKHGSFYVEDILPVETNAVDSDLLGFTHSSMLWKVATSVRENGFGEGSC